MSEETAASEAAPAYDTAKILAALPHRYPMLLVDRVVSLDGLLTLIVTAVLAWGAFTRTGTYLTLGVVVALVAFLGTSAFARFVEGRRR